MVYRQPYLKMCALAARAGVGTALSDLNVQGVARSQTAGRRVYSNLIAAAFSGVETRWIRLRKAFLRRSAGAGLWRTGRLGSATPLRRL
jgi:ABC-type xylose transport system permease subunit